MMNFKTLDYKDGQLILLDQTLLPNEEKYIKIDTAEDLWQCIYHLRVRGAPAIGVAAAYGVCAVMCRFLRSLKEAYNFEKTDCVGQAISKEKEVLIKQSFEKKLIEVTQYIRTSRPTAVNLFYAMDKIDEAFLGVKKIAKNADEILQVIEAKAKELDFEDKEFCKAMGQHGLSLLKPNMSILTHCNAGALATAGIGTCLAPIYLGEEKGYNFKVYSDETRPLLQGARLTSWELKKRGVDVTLICDNMAASLMAKGKIDAVVVGCDRMAANGDGANKIGTLGVAVMANHFGIPFYMFVPSSTIDMSISCGDEIEIEMRPGEEVSNKWYKEQMAPAGVADYNPAFDVTPGNLITAVVTEKGVVRPPYSENLKKILNK